MGITSKEIAKICGVSRGTVDRALNNKPRINPKTKEKILKTAEELGYRPDLLARSLVKGRSMNLGVVVCNIQNHYFAQLVNSIEFEAKKKDYLVNITLQEQDPDKEIRLINSLVDRRMDGIILCPVNKGNAFRDFLKNLPIPVIVISNLIAPDIPFIGIDERKAARDAAEMIVSQKYNRVVFVCPPLTYKKSENVYVHEQLLAGFLDAAHDTDSVEFVVIDHADYLASIRDILNKNNKKTALFCSGDLFALEVLKYLRNIGIKVPGDCGIMGFDGIDTLEYVTPALTTIYTPVEKIGIKAVENLINLIEGKDVDDYLLMDYHIIEGESL